MVSTGTESHTNADDLSGGAKRKRSGRACDRCHRNASRCSPGVEGTVCSRCEDQQVQCTYNRPVKRRGPPARRARKNAIANPMTAEDDPPANTQTSAMTESINISPLMGIQAIPNMAPAIFTPEDGNSAPSPHASILYSEIEEVLEPKIIEKLVDLFYHTIYPIRPYFHWPTFDSQIRQQLYRTDWGVFIVTMAVCALTAGRLYDGLLVPTGVSLLGPEAINLSSQCYAAAVKAMPANITTISDYCQAMKASALLTSVCLQNGNLKRLVAHLSDYICLSTMHKFHLEAHWPEGLTEIERQERRRLFWCVYQQERYLSKNFDLPTRQCEGKSTVLYPAEIFDDTDITATGVHLRPDRVSFIRGWNFCTDMYRLLENMDRLERVRQDVQSDEPGSLTDSFLARMSVPKDFVSDSLHLISKMHADLPPQLKTVQNLTGDPQTDRYRFVASNILLTTQNLKMHLVGTEQPSMHLRCAIASELLDELSAVPLEFFHSLSTGSLHHLAQVGQMLGDATQPPLSAWRYLQVRNILIILADFLEKIESTRISPPGLAVELRSKISQMDRSMQQSSKWNQVPGLLSMGRSLLLGLSDQTGVENTNPLNGQQDDFASQLANGIRPMSQSFSPSMTHFSRLLGLNDPMPDQFSTQELQSSTISVDAITAAEEQRAATALDMAQQGPHQTQESDLGFTLAQSNPIPTDIFDGWQTLLR